MILQLLFVGVSLVHACTCSVGLGLRAKIYWASSKVHVDVAKLKSYRLLYTFIWLLCDAIGQNESEVAQIKFHQVFCIIILGIFNTTFSRKPHRNWLVSSRDASSWRFCKTIDIKEIFPFKWLYFKISIYKFWLILLDHITYYVG